MASALHSYLEGAAHAVSATVQLAPEAQKAAEKMWAALQAGGKIVIFGNGGSAADAQHFAAELVGRYKAERKALPAIALTTDTSILTAVANDYAYDRVFARQVEALVQSGDVAVAISTSGNSKSVLEAVAAARARKAFVVGLTGGTGGKLKGAVDLCLCVPSSETPHIQEGHISLIHAICGWIDEAATK